MSTHFSSLSDDDLDEDEDEREAEIRGLRRWLIATATKGPMAEDAYCPDWFVYLQAAEKLGCKPWELADVPSFWINAALMASQAEAEAKETINRQSLPGKK